MIVDVIRRLHSKPPSHWVSVQLDAVWSQDLRLPAHVPLIPNNIVAPHPQPDPAPQQNVNLCPVDVLDHRYPLAEDRHAVALHQGSVPLASNVVLRPLPDQIVQPRRVKARSLPAERNLPSAADHKDVDVIGGEGGSTGGAPPSSFFPS